MPSVSRTPTVRSHHSIAELVEVRRNNLRYARSLPRGPERDQVRQIALSLRALFKNKKMAQRKHVGGPMPVIYSPSSLSTKGIERRSCSKCAAQMVLARIPPARLGFGSQTFECVQCSHAEKVLAAVDPIQSGVLGWLLGERTTRPLN